VSNCYAFTIGGCGTGTRCFAGTYIGCTEQTVIGPVGTGPIGDPGEYSQQLAALKLQLQNAVAEIEQQQAVVDESLKPQTVEQVEELQMKMRAAIDELDRRKAELNKK
jgi:hypothetical protein